MMVHHTITAMNIVKPALPAHPADFMMVSSAMDAMIGFMLLALAAPLKNDRKNNNKPETHHDQQVRSCFSSVHRPSHSTML
jgi:hypothetical protein